MKKQIGFTLIELMIVVAIALPSYQIYTKRAKFSEVIASVEAVRTAYEICIQTGVTQADCTEGTHGIPANIATGNGSTYVDSVVLDGSGIIIATGTTDMDGATYQLTPNSRR